jgi:excisionase family DNA binding protein
MSVTDAPRRYLTLDQVTDELQVSRRTIERLVAAGIMPTIRIGGSVRVPAEELNEWIDLQRVSAMGARRVRSFTDATPLSAAHRRPSRPAVEVRAHAGEDR